MHGKVRKVRLGLIEEDLECQSETLGLDFVQVEDQKALEILRLDSSGTHDPLCLSLSLPLSLSFPFSLPNLFPKVSLHSRLLSLAVVSSPYKIHLDFSNIIIKSK